MGQSYIPAWQRLGLKLKNQPTNGIEASPASDNISTAGVTPRKRKFTDETDDVQSSPGIPKKSKRSSGAKIAAATNGTEESKATHDDNAQRESRRKSVTFSPDTKAEDGDSSKRLVQAAYASRLARMTGVAEADIVAADSELNNESGPPKPMKNGTEKTAKSNSKIKANGNSISDTKKHKKPSAQPSSKVEKARQRKKAEFVVEYLKEYQNNRASWKFNKSRQVALLKMALDMDSIPAEHEEALKLYLEGLQGEASRQSLRVKAEEVLAAQGDEDRPSSAADDARFSRARVILEALMSPSDMASKVGDLSGDTSTDNKLTNTHTTTLTAKIKVNGVSNGTRPTSQTNGTPRDQSNGSRKATRRSRPKKKRNASYSDSSSESSSSSSDGDD